MKRFTLSGMALAAGAAAILLFSTGTATKAQEKLEKNAQFCDDFDQNVIIGGKLDQASKYLNDDFIEHNVGMLADGLPAFVDKMKARQEAAAARGGGRGRGAGRGGPAPTRTVFSHDDVVVFISVRPARPDPNDASKQLPPNTHFDVYRLKNGKISEHWD